jgi:uncharacterized protein
VVPTNLQSGGLLLMSFLIGLLVGLTSMGGAALMTPFLILVLGVRPVLAVGTDLAYGALTKITGAWMHWRQGTVDLKVVRHLALGSLPGVIAGAIVISYLRSRGAHTDGYVRVALGVVLVCVSIVILLRSLVPKVLPPLPLEWFHRNAKTATTIWGAAVGFAVGLTSVGSGSLITPFLMMIYPGKLPLVVGTDVFHAAILVSAGACFYVGTGQVDWKLVPILLIGSVPGVMLGSRLATRLPPRTLRVALGTLLLATGITLL